MVFGIVYNEFEINFILSGNGHFCHNSSKIFAQTGDIIIVQPNIMHSITPIDTRLIYDTLVFNPQLLYGSKDDRCYISFLKQLITSEYSISNPISKDNAYYTEIRTSVENIISCAKGNTYKLDLLLKSELMRLIWLLDESDAINKNQIADFSLKANYLKPVFSYIQQNYSNPITIDMLSREAHISSSYFMSSFRKLTGISPMEYINRIRINMVCQQLIDSHISISELALNSGFTNLSNFNRQFKNIVGCTPSKYRNSQYPS